MGMDIAVTRCVIATLVEEARRAAERECCGLLLGPIAETAGAGARITQALPAANVHAQPERHFEIDPAALIGAHRAARAGGPALLGFYHSHPNHHPRPSASDCEHAGGDGRIWAIIAAGEVHLWRDTARGFVALAFQIVAA
jgi:proteasome lid subunit RPN8/RPN11